jgi:hypothetical protein
MFRRVTILRSGTLQLDAVVVVVPCSALADKSCRGARGDRCLAADFDHLMYPGRCRRRYNNTRHVTTFCGRVDKDVAVPRTARCWRMFMVGADCTAGIGIYCA